MEKTAHMPIWVYLAFSSINTRKAALLLIAACAVFTAYCIPWSVLVTDRDWVGKFFLIDDWSWFAMMVPVTIWYWFSLKWADRHAAWAVADSASAGK